MHFHVLKFTDIVDEKNASTKEQCEKIAYAYGMCENLLISPLYWVDVEGTRYNFSDLYGRIIDQWLENFKNQAPQDFQVFVRGCYETDVSSLGKKEPEFTPDEMDAPMVKGENGLPVSRFPEEFPSEALERKRKDPVYGEYLFSTQQLNNPISSEFADFNAAMIKWKDPAELVHIPVQYYLTTIDLGETDKARSDPTVITTAMVDRMNRKYIVDIQRGRFKPDEVVERIFRTYQTYKPIRVKIEETGFTRGLMNSIQRKSQMTGVFPPFVFLTRENTLSKTSRIRLTLQPMMKEGLIYFSTGLDEEVKTQLKFELIRFPRYIHDDILDTLSDLYQNEPINGPLRDSPKMDQLLQEAQKIMLQRASEYNEIFRQTSKAESWTGLGEL
jgi:predicted phage terminase large subunit-like protein